MADWDGLRSRLEQCDQSHLLQYLDKLTPEQADKLYLDLNGIDFEKANQYFQKCNVNNQTCEKKDSCLEPLEKDSIGSTTRDAAKLVDWERIGMTQISEGKVSILATRLIC